MKQVGIICNLMGQVLAPGSSTYPMLVMWLGGGTFPSGMGDHILVKWEVLYLHTYTLHSRCECISAFQCTDC